MPSPHFHRPISSGRFASADRHLREAGVTYRAPGETADRMWPLSHLPLIIDEADWQQLTTGIAQRAQLLEMVLRDLYGEGRLVADGAVPAAAIAGSNEYLRAVCGIKPPGGRYLHFYAADVGRGPDGRWWVLNDRTQAPSGAGYALENRLVLSRAFSSLYKSMNVERVAPFFEAFRDSLRASADRDEPRIGLLTPGAFSETYFEHATLARYLGFLLVEGDDLAVSGDRIHIRTVAGLKRLDVLLRRVDSNFLDPLELDAASHLGVPGLIDVLRKDGVVVANMPGSGVLEARALLGFLPSLCRRLLSESLIMPHIATWWCGQKSAREEVLSRLEDFAIEGAYGRAVPGFSSHGPVLAGELSPAERDRLEKRDHRPRHRLCRPGTGAAVDDAGVGAGTDHAAPVRAAGVCRGNAPGLDHPARGLLPDCRTARCPCRLDGRRCAVGGCLDCLRQGGVGFDAAAGRRSGAHPAHRRRGAEPRRGQSVLARPLSRARRGDAAADPRARRADARPRQGIVDRAAFGRAHPAASGDLGRDLAGDADQPRKGRRRGAAEPGEIRLGLVIGKIGAAYRELVARAAFARRLADHHRDGGASRLAGRRR
jgi:uncharacterized circularly permuted ATP-grasp superfamily protein